MPRFGVLSFSGTGHINPLICLARRLMARGHSVVFFHSPEIADIVRGQGLEFISIGNTPPHSHAEQATPSQRPEGIAGVRYRLHRVESDMDMFLREAPAAIRDADVDALVLDEIALAGPTVAQMLGLPYFIISTSVPHNFGWSAPRRIMPPRTWVDRLQQRLLEISIVRMKGPVRRHLDRFRRSVGLSPTRMVKQVFPELAHFSVLPQCMDFPRSGLPANFHYTGPFVDEAARTSVDFPWNRLDGRPLVYASLGTTLQGDTETFELIAEACAGLAVQLVISLGGRRAPETFHHLAGTPLVVRNAPQLEILKRSAVVITHAGPNTAFESLLQGKPMIAIPKSFDQPAIAHRLEWLGVAEVISLKQLSAQRIRTALLKVLHSDSYQRNAEALRQKILASQGLERATSIIEEELHRYNSRHSMT